MARNKEELLSNFGGVIDNCLDTVFSNLDEDEASPLIQTSTFLNANDVDVENFFKRHQSNFTIFSMNADSLHAKHAHLQLFVESFLQKNFYFSAICIQEARINKYTDCKPLDLPQYELIPQPQTVSSKGGLVIYLHQDFTHHDRTKELLKIPSKIFEGQFVDVYGPSIQNKITIANIYRPPRCNNQNALTKLAKELKPILSKLKKENTYSFVTSDMNINLLKVGTNQCVRNYFDFLCDLDFLPQITIPTRFAKKTCSLIDNIFINPPESQGILDGTKIESHVFLKQVGRADHQPCIIGINIELKKIHPPKFIKFRKPVANAEAKFKNDITTANLEQRVRDSPNDCPDQAYKTIADTVTEAYNKNFPLIETRFRRDRHKVQPWMTDELLKKISLKDQIYAQFRKAKVDTPLRSELKAELDLRNHEISADIVAAKNNFYSQKIEEYKNDIKKTWTTINQIVNKRRSKTKYPPFFEVDGKKITDRQEMASEFNQFFSTIGQKLADEIPSNGLPRMEDFLGEKPRCSFNFQPTNSDRVSKILHEMAPKHSAGQDGIPPCLVKDVIEDIAPALSIAINLSIKVGIFPSELKIAKIVPLFKNKGKIWHFENWRPVALLPALSKVYEKELHLQITEYFTSNSLFCENQFGFRKGRSTEDATLIFHDRIKQMLDNRQTPFAVFLDLSKAFDTIDHDLLLRKLAFYGFSNLALRLMESYLRDRRQYVDLDGMTSDQCDVSVGVPQGSILGPLLFLIYVNDLPNCTDILDATLFADDTSLSSCFSAFTLGGAVNVTAINSELNKIYKWLCVNKLSLNVSKTKYMIFESRLDPRPLPTEPLKINGEAIKQCTEFDFLGLTIDSKLTWKPHTSKIFGKITRTLGVMKKVKRYAPPPVLKMLYQSLVNSHFSYGIKCWVYACSTLITTQKKAIRIMSNVKNNSHTSPLFKNNGILKLLDIFKLSCLKMHYRIERELAAPAFRSLHTRNWEVHNHNTRQRVIRITQPNFQSHKDCFRFSLPSLLDEMPGELLDPLHNVSISTFAHNIKKYFLDQYWSVCTKDPCQPCGRLPR